MCLVTGLLQNAGFASGLSSVIHKKILNDVTFFQDLERYIENLQKNQRHEVAIEIHRHRETQRRVAYLEDLIQGLEMQIKVCTGIHIIHICYVILLQGHPRHFNSIEGNIGAGLMFGKYADLGFMDNNRHDRCQNHFRV
jgi:low affinity Fe/Cu permease